MFMILKQNGAKTASHDDSSPLSNAMKNTSRNFRSVVAGCAFFVQVLSVSIDVSMCESVCGYTRVVVW